MSFIKSRKNIFLSLVSYVVGVLTAYLWVYFVPAASYPGISNKVGVGLVVVLTLLGMLFGFKSNKAKESSWAGNVLILVGFLIILFPLYAVPLAMIIDSFIG